MGENSTNIFYDNNNTSTSTSIKSIFNIKSTSTRNECTYAR